MTINFNKCDQNITYIIRKVTKNYIKVIIEVTMKQHLRFFCKICQWSVQIHC